MDCQKLELVHSDLEWQQKKRLEVFNEEVKSLKVELTDLESKHKLELRGVEDLFKSEKSQLESKL